MPRFPAGLNQVKSSRSNRCHVTLVAELPQSSICRGGLVPDVNIRNIHAPQNHVDLQNSILKRHSSLGLYLCRWYCGYPRTDDSVGGQPSVIPTDHNGMEHIHFAFGNLDRGGNPCSTRALGSRPMPGPHFRLALGATQASLHVTNVTHPRWQSMVG